MKTVFLLQHLHTMPDESEDVKAIGIYTSRGKALEAAARLAVQPGFADFPRIMDPLKSDAVDGFYIDEYELDKDNWTDGFVTV